MIFNQSRVPKWKRDSAGTASPASPEGWGGPSVQGPSPEETASLSSGGRGSIHLDVPSSPHRAWHRLRAQGSEVAESLGEPRQSRLCHGHSPLVPQHILRLKIKQWRRRRHRDVTLMAASPFCSQVPSSLSSASLCFFLRPLSPGLISPHSARAWDLDEDGSAWALGSGSSDRGRGLRGEGGRGGGGGLLGTAQKRASHKH